MPDENSFDRAVNAAMAKAFVRWHNTSDREDFLTLAKMLNAVAARAFAFARAKNRDMA